MTKLRVATISILLLPSSLKRAGTFAYPFLACFLLVNLLSVSPRVSAQVIGEAAELDRLIDRADEAIANGDPGTAGLTIGKAALMASILAERAQNESIEVLYRSAEALFRTEENGYRALALFDQAGGRPPAPSSACQLLSLAAHHRETAAKHLDQIPATVAETHQDFYQHTLKTTQEWKAVLEELQQDFGCR